MLSLKEGRERGENREMANNKWTHVNGWYVVLIACLLHWDRSIVKGVTKFLTFFYRERDMLAAFKLRRTFISELPAQK